MLIKKKKGQSTVEYIILVTAVVVVIIFFVVNPNSPFRNQMNSTLGNATGSMVNMAARLNGAFAPAP
jgi:uncharacterized protein (UPF0333 family)